MPPLSSPSPLPYCDWARGQGAACLLSRSPSYVANTHSLSKLAAKISGGKAFLLTGGCS